MANRKPKKKLFEISPIVGEKSPKWRFPDISSIQCISPADYFQTSGDALDKTEKLLHDIYSIMGKVCALRDRLKELKGDKPYLQYVPYEGKILTLPRKRK